MIQSLFQIVSNECIARNTYKMVLSGDVSSINRPGQFVNIKLKGFFLGRPISVCDIDDCLQSCRQRHGVHEPPADE